MNGNAAAYLTGPLQQYYGGAAGGPVITLLTYPIYCTWFCPTNPPQCLDLGQRTVLRTYGSPECPIPGRLPQIAELPSVGCGPPMQMAAMAAQQDCKNVMWTAGCTFAGGQQAPGGLGTSYGIAQCNPVTWTIACDAGSQAQADCKNVLWTAGCTFPGGAERQAGAQITLRTIGLQCWTNPTLATHCFICPPLNAGFPPPETVYCPQEPCCKPVLRTAACTIVPSKLPDIAQANLAAADCKNVMWTAGCTFAGQQAAQRAGQAEACFQITCTIYCTEMGPEGAPARAGAADCKNVMWTAGCTFPGGQAGQAEDCGNVLTTLVCTLGKASADNPDRPMCITLLTHVPTWCAPDSDSVDCKHVLWSAGCTFAGAGGAQECGQVLTTLVCTLAGPQKDAEQCGNVLGTLACTLSEAQLPKGEGGELGCKDVLWTAGCTFDGLAKGERCGDVLTTLACTLVAAPAEGSAEAGCKDVLWTAGCTFAAQPSEREVGCKVVAWTAGCTF